jgi:hypothetical protein
MNARIVLAGLLLSGCAREESILFSPRHGATYQEGSTILLHLWTSAEPSEDTTTTDDTTNDSDTTDDSGAANAEEDLCVSASLQGTAFPLTRAGKEYRAELTPLVTSGWQTLTLSFSGGCVWRRVDLADDILTHSVSFEVAIAGTDDAAPEASPTPDPAGEAAPEPDPTPTPEPQPTPEP